MTYESFIAGLKNLEGDKKELKRLIDKKDELFYLETGVSGLDPSKIHTSGNPSMIAQVRLSKIDELDELECEIKLIQANIKHVLEVYDRQDTEIKTLLKTIYFDGKKKVEVAREFCFKSDMELERYLKRSYL